MTGLLLALVACGGRPDPAAWRTEADCEPIADPGLRDDCLAHVAVEVFRASRERGEALLERVSSPLVRDYILLAVTREVDPSTFAWCQRIASFELKERCRTFVHRPHLHRELERR